VLQLRNIQEMAGYIVDWMKQVSLLAGAKGGVFGVSGGIDSALVVALAKEAWNENCLGLVLPCGFQNTDVDDAIDVLCHFGCKYEVLDLTPVFEAFTKILPEGQGDSPLHQANLKPRLRMAALYYYASQMNYIVVGTTNKSERFVGYFTKHGDGGVDIQPLGDLTKAEVKALSRYLGVPERIVEKVPSGGLWEGQTDEKEMGITYKDLDGYLMGEKIPEEARARILQMHKRSEHKRALPPIPYLGTGFKEE
jgi:NAD+ synthase